MTRFNLIVIACIFLLISCTGVKEYRLVKKSVEEFYIAIFNGKPLDTRRWLFSTEETLAYLEHFGGLPAMSRGYGEFAGSRGGIENITVDVESIRDSRNAIVSVSVSFFDGCILVRNEGWVFDQGYWKLKEDTNGSVWDVSSCKEK